MTTTHDPHESILGTIGDTPLVELHDTPANVSVYAKLETFNPGGSVKDRIGKYILERLLERGDLPPGGTVVEPTAGNTGIGMALAATRLDLEAVFVVPRGFSEEKERLMAALGGEIVHVPGEAGMAGALETAEAIADRRADAVVPQQFATPLNAETHAETTGPEILEALDSRVGAVVAGVGSGGTLVGIARTVRERVPGARIVAVEPDGSTYGERLGEERTEAPYKTEGIGTHDPAFAEVFDPDTVDDIVTVSDRDTHGEVTRLASAEGHLVGSSSGAASVAARRVAESIAAGELEVPHETVVTVFPDSSERYLSKNVYGSFEQWEGKA
ncbi:cysteine synthase family protein [Natronomonas sp. F2-12]|jgi:cysteine synthase A|uniref:Cysteine synthase family protein n=1 Tax=Natronomonas aquatica TaxID=2841590 RepID=A0A9R1D6M6_9EURY|nr:cysteine synthase family protein [Natronomonas aquatica]MCQ4332230.1 cysteine synthase family protein [Natronomonas aquatica]